MKQGNIAVLALLSALIAWPAMALDLQSARSSGQIGEKLDGYVAAVAPSADVNALISEVNAKRKAEYARISAQNGQPASLVGKVAAEQIINKLPSGALYQDVSGNWKKR